VTNKTLWTAGAKTWGQRTNDGRYVIVQDQSATRVKPLSDGGDGRRRRTPVRRDVLSADEVPARRYQDNTSPAGPAYFRGVSEGDGKPPGDHLWITYSRTRKTCGSRAPPCPSLGRDPSLCTRISSMPATVPISNGGISTFPSGANPPVLKPARTTMCWRYGRRTLRLRQGRARFPQPKSDVKFRVQPAPSPKAPPFMSKYKASARPPHGLRLDQTCLVSIGNVPHRSHRDRSPSMVRRRTRTRLQPAILHRTNRWPRVHQSMPFTEKSKASSIVFRTGPFRGWVAPAVLEKGEDKPSGLDTEDQRGPMSAQLPPFTGLITGDALKVRRRLRCD